jgi:hypothetical protein
MAIKIICCHPIFIENALELCKRYNWPIVRDLVPEYKDIYILLGANEKPDFFLKAQEESNFKFYYIILNSEQIESRFLKNEHYIKLLKDNFVFSYSNYLKLCMETNLNIKCSGSFHFQFLTDDSHSHSYKNVNVNENENVNVNVKANKEYDVVFVGSFNNKRKNILDSLKLTSLNIYSDFEWKHISPADITNLLEKSKVVLNIPYYNNNALETHRIIKALCCGCEVISLHSFDKDLDDIFDDYIYFTDDIIECVKKYFNNELVQKKHYKELLSKLDSTFGVNFISCVNAIKDNI